EPSHSRFRSSLALRGPKEMRPQSQFHRAEPVSAELKLDLLFRFVLLSPRFERAACDQLAFWRDRKKRLITADFLSPPSYRSTNFRTAISSLRSCSFERA